MANNNKTEMTGMENSTTVPVDIATIETIKPKEVPIVSNIDQLSYDQIKDTVCLLESMELVDCDDDAHIVYDVDKDMVFLVDGVMRMWGVTDNGIEEYYSCPDCDREGFARDFATHVTKCTGCNDIADMIKSEEDEDDFNIEGIANYVMDELEDNVDADDDI